jgi:hypothetical protein
LKSSTRNHPNAAHVADRRFEAQVQRERIEQQHILSGHQKERQELRDALTLAMEKFKSISERTVSDLEEFKTKAIQQIDQLKDRLRVNEAIIIDQRRSIEDLHQQILSIYILYASKTDLEKAKKDLERGLQTQTVSHINSFQELQKELMILIHSLKNDQVKLTLDIEKKLARLAEKGESNFSISRIDRDGVVKELRIYQKDLFVIEKKIENIYTLIERINKRGELCHKPA